MKLCLVNAFLAVANKNFAAELSFLRMQANPHFLFNTLNCIYSLSLKKSDAAPDAVLRLSKMMRYMLYEREDQFHHVDLQREIEFLEDYIGLQQTRFSDKLYVNFLVEGNVTGKKIAPLLLIPFIENGFKHGLLTDAERPLQILLQIESNKLVLQVKNGKNPGSKEVFKGIGLENVSSRLKLLYPRRHKLTIFNTNENYHSTLAIMLS